MIDILKNTRVIGTIVSIIVVVIILGIYACVAVDDTQAESSDVPWTPRLIELHKQALDDAYKKHVGLLYDIWMKDYSEGQPKRAITGATNARRAYLSVLAEIEKRERATAPP